MERHSAMITLDQMLHHARSRLTRVLVCSQVYRSSLAAVRLQDLGLSNATDLEGGYKAWKAWRDRG